MAFLLLMLALETVAKDYQYWCVGNCERDVETNPRKGLILMGGGTDVDDAFKKQVEWVLK